MTVSSAKDELDQEAADDQLEREEREKSWLQKGRGRWEKIL